MKFKVILTDNDGFEVEQTHDLTTISSIYQQTVFNIESVTPVVDSEFEKELNLKIDDVIEDMQSYSGKLSEDDELHRRIISCVMTLVFMHRQVNKSLLEPMLRDIITDAANILNIEPMEHEIDQAVDYVRLVTLRVVSLTTPQKEETL